MATFDERFGTTPAGASPLDETLEPVWAHWLHLVEVTPEKFTERNFDAYLFNRPRALELVVRWSLDGDTSGADPVFDTSLCPQFSASINDGLGGSKWTQLNSNGLYWSDNLGPSPDANSIFHPAFVIYSQQVSSRWQSHIIVAGKVDDPPFQSIVDRTIAIHATGVRYS